MSEVFNRSQEKSFKGSNGVRSMTKLLSTDLSPVALLEALASQSAGMNRMLLESSEIESKQNLKSILMLQAAIRIECNANRVDFKALTANGVNALNSIRAKLAELQSLEILPLIIDSEENGFGVEYFAQQQTLDEDSRLKQPSPIDALRLVSQAFEDTGQSEYATFICGVFAFDFIASFESLPAVNAGENTCPDYVFYLAESLIVFDHLRETKRLICNHFTGNNDQQTYFELSRYIESLEIELSTIETKGDNAQPNQVQVSHSEKQSTVSIDKSDQQFAAIVEQMKTRIVQGDIFQVVPSRTFSLPCRSTLLSYEHLKAANPSPYLFYMQDEGFCLFGASPESALKYQAKTNLVELYPIAGTRGRGRNSKGEIDLDLDARVEAELKLDSKEVSEHMMLVDLARNDIARIAQPGSTHVPRLLAVDRYSQVMHLVSCVQGQLRHDLDALNAYQACMNMGTLTGAPKIKASQLIRESEGQRRGSYGGAVGYLNGQGDMDTCIVIRAAFCRQQTAYIQAGAGVVYDSVPQLEAEETSNKARAVINAVLAANMATDSNDGQGAGR